MKKEAVVKNLNKLYTTVTDAPNKIRDLLYAIDDPDLASQVDEWCERFEEFLDEVDGVDGFLETIDAIFDIE
jgi:hypothetical protein